MLCFLGLLCLYNIARASLPTYVDEIKSRTRWCFGEGTPCSLSLLHGFDFSLCCAPYVCTTVVIAREPNWLLSSEYKEHRCFLPPALAIDTTFKDNATDSTKKWKVDALEDKDKVSNSESREPVSVEPRSPVLDEQKSVESRTNLNESQPPSNSRENEVYVVKRSTTGSEIFENFDNLKSIEETNQSLDNSTRFARNSSEDILHSMNSSMETYSDYGDNKTDSKEYRLTNYTDELSSEMFEDSSNTTATNKQYEIRNTEVTKPITSSNSSFQNASSETFSEEDWHSSEMQYDTRLTLRKVVTVLPFHFFDSVRVIRINESIESSA